MELDIGTMIFQIISFFLLVGGLILFITFLIFKLFKSLKKQKNELNETNLPKKSSLVWYASYGSNLNDERFLCYIKGGKPKGSSKIEQGASDKTMPRKDTSIRLPYPLYFAKYSSRWDGAVAFIDTQKDEQNYSHGRMYLITEEQFIDVVNQENSTDDIEIDFEQVKQQGQVTIRKSWYGNIIYLGEKEGYPIFTFTAYWNMQDTKYEVPSEAYLKMLMIGLKKLNILTFDEIIEYFSNKPGIKGNYSKQQLAVILEQI